MNDIRQEMNVTGVNNNNMAQASNVEESTVNDSEETLMSNIKNEVELMFLNRLIKMWAMFLQRNSMIQ